jgi:hypothetical protein
MVVSLYKNLKVPGMAEQIETVLKSQIKLKIQKVIAP